MKIKLLVLGKTAEKYLIEGIEKYIKRINFYTNFEIKTISDLKNSKNLSQPEIKEREGKLILSEINESDFIVLLDENGGEYNSLHFADFISNQLTVGTKNLIFVVGGAYGFSDMVYKIASLKIALSKMTFSHQLVRLIFVEQLYRAFTIIKGEPYHHK